MKTGDRVSRPSAEWSGLPDMNGLALRLAAPPSPRRADVDDLLGVAPSSTLAAPTLPRAAPAVAAIGTASRRAAVVLGAFLGVLAAAALAGGRATEGDAVTQVAPGAGGGYAPRPRAESPTIVARSAEVPDAPRARVVAALPVLAAPPPDARRERRRGPAAPRRAAARPSAPPAMAPQPDRAATADAFARVSGVVRRCGDGSGRTAVVTATFASTGRVTTARVAGAPLGPVVGCVVAAVRRVTLPPFSRPLFTVSYPYPLR